jgi:hypothetical protein
MSDTPRTDKVASDLINNARIIAPEMVEFSRTLERQLAEAQDNKNDATARFILCEIERDQARKELAEAQAEIERMRPIYEESIRKNGG